MFLASLRHANQARGFQNVGATGILRLFLFFFNEAISSKSVGTTPPHTYASSLSCAYCCRRWIQLSKWYPSVLFHLASLHSFLIFVERENCRLFTYADPSLQKYIPDFYGGLTPLAAEMTKDFFVSARVYPEEYHGYCHL